MKTYDSVEAWNGPGRSDGVITTVSPADNALHARPERTAFEHWYFDAQLDNGYTVVGFLVKRRPEDPPMARPWVEIIVYQPDGSRRQIAQRYPERAAFFSTEEVDVRIGPNSARVEFDENRMPTYHVVFDEEDVRLDLTFRNEILPWMPGRGENHFGDGGVFGWCVGAPRAEVTGRVVIGDEQWDVTGRGYADHNWGVGNMPRVIERWHWGRLYTDDYSLLYAVVACNEKYNSVQIMPVMLAKGDEILLSTGEVEFTLGSSVYDDVARQDYPQTFTLEAPGRFRLEMRVQQVLQSHSLIEEVPIVGSRLLRPIVDRVIGKPGYFRFQSDFTLAVTQDDGSVETVEGSTLHELVALT
ncbi:lipocalin-like domain-containing protein [Gordonia shandongensis]|uniref:lipocalin-like domain-containing protein n=1 Tax=Gordonia shandongensis TaxID=376351 RepID=UPI00041C4B12|nr:lipocalin-like domain-containing protein [Gordonia shandongensis]